MPTTQPKAGSPATVSITQDLWSVALSTLGLPGDLIALIVGLLPLNSVDIADLCSTPPPAKEFWLVSDLFHVGEIGTTDGDNARAKCLRMLRALIWPTYCEFSDPLVPFAFAWPNQSLLTAAPYQFNEDTRVKLQQMASEWESIRELLINLVTTVEGSFQAAASNGNITSTKVDDVAATLEGIAGAVQHVEEVVVEIDGPNPHIYERLGNMGLEVNATMQQADQIHNTIGPWVSMIPEIRNNVTTVILEARDAVGLWVQSIAAVQAGVDAILAVVNDGTHQTILDAVNAVLALLAKLPPPAGTHLGPAQDLASSGTFSIPADAVGLVVNVTIPPTATEALDTFHTQWGAGRISSGQSGAWWPSVQLKHHSQAFLFHPGDQAVGIDLSPGSTASFRMLILDAPEP